MLKANGEADVIEIADTLKAYQDAVGGYIEVVSLTERYALIVNEEGKLQDLPLNNRATAICQRYLNTSDVIAGDAFIVKKDGEGFVDIDMNCLLAFLKYLV